VKIVKGVVDLDTIRNKYLTRKLPTYKPVILRVNEVNWLNPFKIFSLILIITIPVSISLGGNIVTSLQLGYSIALTIYLVRKYEQYLIQLKPVLNLTDEQFENERFRLSHFTRKQILGGGLIAPAFFLFVNWGSPDLQAFINYGEISSIGFVWSFLLATISWIFNLQALTMILSNVWQFKRLGQYHTKINLLDTDTLNPFSMIGISTLLIIAGSYTLIPIAFLDSSELLMPALLSLIVTLPMAVFLLLWPIVALRQKIKIAKKKEHLIITKAIHGDYSELQNSHLDLKGEKATQLDLILYRKHIEDIDEWPIDNSGAVRLVIYFTIPIVAWIMSSVVDRFLSSVM